MADEYSDLGFVADSQDKIQGNPHADLGFVPDEVQKPSLRINAPQILKEGIGKFSASGAPGASFAATASRPAQMAINQVPSATFRAPFYGIPYQQAAQNPQSVPSLRSGFEPTMLNALSRVTGFDKLPQSAQGVLQGAVPPVAHSLYENAVNLPDSMANPANLLLLMAGGLKPVASAAEGLGEALVNAGGKVFEPFLPKPGELPPAKFGPFKTIRDYAGLLSPDEIDQTIDQGISKGVRPSVAGKNTYSQSQKYAGNARNAVKAIVERRGGLKILNEAGEETGKLPESLDQFSQAIEQTKKAIYDEYSKNAKTATGKGITIDAEPFAQNVEKAANHKTVRVRFPELSGNLNKLAARLRATGSFTPEELEDYIASLNSSLQAFYKNPNPNAVSQAVADASLAKQMRTALDDAIEGAAGKGYGELKKKYGSLRSIESDVNKRAVVDARRNYKGFFDLADIISSGDIAHGVLSLNPSMVAKGALQRSLGSYFKFLNDPNRIVKNMFATVGRSYVPEVAAAAEESIPKMLSYEGKNPKLLEGPQPSKYLGVTDKAGEGFERVNPEDSEARIAARTKQISEAVQGPKRLPPPSNRGEGFEINTLQEANKKLGEFAFKYFSPETKKLEIPQGVTIGTKEATLLKKVGINPYTGEIKNPKLVTALEAAMKRAKSLK